MIQPHAASAVYPFVRDDYVVAQADDDAQAAPPHRVSCRHSQCHRATRGSSQACTMSVARKVSDTRIAMASVRPWITG